MTTPGVVARLEAVPKSTPSEPATVAPLPAFEGYRTIERLGGGAGEVFELSGDRPSLRHLLAAGLVLASRERTNVRPGGAVPH
jgi:hypothetical protein